MNAPHANDNRQYVDPFALTTRDKWLIGAFFTVMAILGLWFGVWGYESARVWAEARMR